VERLHREPLRLIDRETVHRHTGLTRELAALLQQLLEVALLLHADILHPCRRLLPSIVRAHRLGGAPLARPVKEEDELLDLVCLDEEAAVLPDLARPEELAAAARGQPPCAPRDVEAVVVTNPELRGEERVGGFLQPAIRARDDEDVRPGALPLDAEPAALVLPARRLRRCFRQKIERLM
jgi:hypothetical protein